MIQSSAFMDKTQRRAHLRGFTLIELMIAVVIVSILAAIAIPTYQSQTERTRRAAAQGDLLELAQGMERLYTNAFDYRVGGANPVLPFTTSPRNSTNPFYNLSFVGAVTRNTFTLQSVPINAQAGDNCGTLTVDQAGTRTATAGGVAVANCW